jgi:acetylornithine deacetylase/succinyl-diaminopimelate desuccinylase-like protein
MNNSLKSILKTLVEMPTVTGDYQANHQAFDYIANFASSRGVHVERFEANGYESLVATTKKTKTPKVLLAGHIDVVPAPQDFFALREVDDKFYGRGVLDMKFAIASYLQIIDDLKTDLQAYDFGLMITSDEELGGRDGVEMLVKKGYLPQVCILPDGGDNWQIQTHSKGFLYITLNRYGKPAHGSRPWLGDSAILPLLDAIKEVQALFPTNDAGSNTVNIGRLHGGKAINQVPDAAEVSFDIRVMSETDKQKILKHLKVICDTYNLEMVIELDGVVGSFSLDNPFIATFAKLIQTNTGVKVTGSHTLGSNDTRHFAPYSVPCISFYPVGGDHHGPSEWLETKGLTQTHQIIGEYVAQVAKL